MPSLRDAPSLWSRLASRPWRAQAPATNRIYFLMVTVDGVAGVPRTVLTLAARLADTHDVEIISVYRRHDRPNFAVDPRIKVTYLYDQRRKPGDGAREGPTWIRAAKAPHAPKRHAALDGKPSYFLPQEKELSRFTDFLLARHLPRLAPGVLITVRPALHAAALELAPRHLITVAQDHLNILTRTSKPHIRDLMAGVADGYDALVTLTEADAADYRDAFPRANALICCIPNAVAWEPVVAAPDLGQKIVVSGGRFEHRKGFHRLIEAYAPITQKHPQWQLHIYGKGPEEGRLRALIAKLGVEENVRLMGFAHDFQSALSEGSIYAMAPIYEGFGLVFVEAMSRGLPVVTYDCPRGPGEIVEDGVNGRLIPDGDSAALTAAIVELIEDQHLRQRMGARALADVGKWQADSIARRWDELFAQLLDRRQRLAAG
jgi:glycosyltransferase involved in cell wall biosynthesis